MSAHRYYMACEPYFWQWDDGGESIAIPGGSTLMFREQLLALIKQLHPVGLPQFGMMLLLQVASSVSGKRLLKELHPIVAQLVDERCSTSQVDFEEGWQFLEMINQLPDSCKTESNVVEVLKALIGSMHNTYSKRRAKQLFLELQRTSNAQEKYQSNEFKVHKLATELKSLALLKRRFPKQEDLENGLSGVIDVETELVTTNTGGGEEAAPFTEELLQNPHTFKVGALIKPLWSGLTIPVRNLSDSDNLFGGVTDLSNSGDLQQLLLTEFANDDLVFLSRLANREALYYRRDVPQGNPKTKRIFLLDISLSMWGIPKLTAWSSLLSIVNHPKNGDQYSHEIYLLGELHHPTNITNLGAIIQSMSKLSARYNCVTGLQSYFADHEATGKQEEVFFLTSRRGLEDADLVSAIEQHRSWLNYLLLHDEDGKIDLFQYQSRNRKHLHSLQLPLAQLWKKAPQPKQRKRDRKSELGNHQLPLLLPVDKYLALRFPEGPFAYKLVKKYGLFRTLSVKSGRPHQGWELIWRENIINVVAPDFEVGVLPNGQEVLLLFQRHKKILILINLHTQERVEEFFTDWQDRWQQNFFFIKDHFYHSNHLVLLKIDLAGKSTVVKDRELQKELLEVIAERRKKLSSPGVASYPYASTLVNIKTVGISSRKQLVFNQFELFPNVGDKPQLMIPFDTGPINLMAEATKDGQEFVFADKSKIVSERMGFVRLVSSNPRLPEVYVPTILNQPLGLATVEEFSGNGYYAPSRLCYLSVVKVTSKPLESIKIIRKLCPQVSMADAKRVVDQHPALLPGCWKFDEAMLLEMDFEDYGLTVKAVEVKPNALHQERIALSVFFARYVDAFIQQVLDSY